MDRYKLDGEIPIFTPRRCKTGKIIVYYAMNSVVLSDIKYSIEKNHIKLSFSMGVNSKDNIRTFGVV